MAAEHRYKLLLAEKKGIKRNRPEQDAEDLPEENEKPEKPKKTPKGKAKAAPR